MSKILTTRSTYLAILLVALGVLCFFLFAPYINIIVIAFVLVELFYPLYRFVESKIKNKGASAILSTIAAFLVVMIPISAVILITAGEALSFSRQAQQYIIDNDLARQLPRQVVDSLNDILINLNVPEQYWIKSPDINALVQELGGGLANSIGQIAGGILTGGLGLLFQIFLLTVSMIYLFQLRGSLRDIFSYFSPLGNDLDNLFFDRFVNTTRAVVKGSFIVALLQATAVIVPMLFMGVVSPVLLWLIMLIASLVPVGSGVVWFPAGIVMILSNQPVQGILLIAYSAVIINLIDTIARPYVMRGATQLHPLLTLFSVLGGISMFGLIGVLYGPLITVFFISLVHVYNSQTKEGATAV